MQSPRQNILRRARRLRRDQRGQAAVETMFALTVLVLVILLVAQLYALSDHAIAVVAGGEYRALKQVHALDDAQTFRFLSVNYSKSLKALPGINMALRHFDQAAPAGSTPGSFSVSRDFYVAGGAFKGMAISKFGIGGDGMGLSQTGRRAIVMGPIVGY